MITDTKPTENQDESGNLVKPVLDAVFYYISTKWTNKNDGFITLWRKNSSGYCWYKNWAGTYEEMHEEDADVLTVSATVVDKLWVKVNYDGAEREVLLNNTKTLKVLGLKTKDLLKKYNSNCPEKYLIDDILVK